MQPEKIHIVGGGISSLVAAFELTEDVSWRERYEITLHQMGWRLGGKGASGRNAAHHDRIEEHGLHLFFGYYENAFRVMRRCYAELGRPPEHPLARWDQAFKKRSRIVCKEAFDGRWHDWVLDFVENDDLPGDPDASVSGTQGAQMMLALLHNALNGSLQWGGASRSLIPRSLSRRLAPLRHLDLREVHARHLQWCVPLLRALRESVRRYLGDRVARDFRARQTWSLVDFGVSILIGMIVDDLVTEPVDWHKLDHLDFRDWLRGHGASDAAVDSGVLRALADASFATCNTGAAGTSLYMTLRMLCTYKGAVAWEMQGSMGEIVIAPLYEVLRRRGVKFEFFQRVDRLELGFAPDGRRRVERVIIGQQATLKDAASGYRPLRDVKGLPCWPSEPLYEQLVEGEALRAQAHNLENWWGEWPDVAPKTLTAGVDFDHLILGVGAGALPYLCDELIHDPHNPRFGEMVKGLRTTMTQAAQLWMKPTLEQLGVRGERPIVLGFANPFNTWADMSHLVPRESWSGGHVGSVAYLCAALEDEADFVPPPREAHDYPRTLQERVVANTQSWLREHAAALWPRATRSDQPEAFDPSLLEGPAGLEDEARLRRQHLCAIWNPSDRYVLAPIGNTHARLRPEDSGCANLVLTGDWTLNSFSMGCVEAATAAGMRAARVLCGRPRQIFGEWLDAVRPSDPLLRERKPSAPAELRAPYVRRHGDLIAPQPYLSTGTTMRWFVLEAEQAALQNLCDRQLNLGSVHYKPLAPVVAFVAADMKRTFSLEPSANTGWVREQDYGFWVPLVAGEVGGDGFEPRRVVWFQPYLWVDSGPALVAGREIFGLAKSLGELRCEASSPPSFHVRTFVTRGTPDSEAKMENLIHVHAPEHAHASTLQRVAEGAKSVEELGLEIVRNLKLAERGGLLFDRAFLDDLLHGRMRVVGLKQFPKPETFGEACYQAIVETPSLPQSPVRGRWLPGAYQVDIQRWASHEIVRNLGLRASDPDANGWQSARALAHFELEFDFVFGRGEVVTRTA